MNQTNDSHERFKESEGNFDNKTTYQQFTFLDSLEHLEHAAEFS